MDNQMFMINTNLAGLIKSCEENVEFRLPALTWTRFLNEGIMDLYDLLFIESEKVLKKEEGNDYFILPEDLKQLYMVGTINKEYQNWDIASSKNYDWVYANAESEGTYRIFENKLYINGYDGDTIAIKYYRKPKFLEAINKDRKEPEYRIDVPNEYIEPVILYACMRAMQAEDETERYQVFANEYKKKKDWLYNYTHRYRPERKLYWKVRR